MTSAMTHWICEACDRFGVVFSRILFTYSDMVAQQWEKPRAVSWRSVTTSSLQSKDGKIGLHFNYHAQLEPELVLEVLKGCRLNAF